MTDFTLAVNWWFTHWRCRT